MDTRNDQSPASERLHRDISLQKDILNAARKSGDRLRIELAEDGLNSLLDQLSQLSHVTTKES